MGFDDAVCELSPTGRHELELDEVVVKRQGLDQVHACSWCGAIAYEASEPAARPPL